MVDKMLDDPVIPKLGKHFKLNVMDTVVCAERVHVVNENLG
jgi:hypothetical protein